MLEHEAKSKAVEETLRQPEVHEQWEHDFRTEQNARFYDDAIRYVGEQLDPSSRPKLLDAGCGICDYAIRLARQGFDVTAVDFSERVLENARENLRRAGSPAAIKLGQENLLRLSFPSESFDAILCWGVLMHIPDIEKATAELARVLRVGGRLAVSEGNMRSFEGRLLRVLRKAMGRGAAQIVKGAAGVEHWTKGAAGDLLTRECDIEWLIDRFNSLGLSLRTRVAGQFSESYVRATSKTGQRMVHAFNGWWFRSVRWASPALGNILVFEKGSP